MIGAAASVLVVGLFTPAPEASPPAPIQRPHGLDAPAEPEPAPVEELAPAGSPPPQSGPQEPVSADPAVPAEPIEDFSAWIGPTQDRPPAPAEHERPREARPSPAVARDFTARRRGIVVSAAIGVGACGHDWCDGYRVGFGARGELGWRFGVFALVASFGGNLGPFDPAVLSEEVEWPMKSANVRLFDIAGGLQVHPIRAGRIDPFFGVRLGYSNVVLRARGEQGVVARESVRRGGIPFVIGVPVYATERVSIGPRFDVTVPFAGDVCYRWSVGDTSEASCTAVPHLESEVGVNSAELPVPWSVLIDVRVILGPWG